MQLLTLILLVVPAVYACGDNAYRCKNNDVTVDTDWDTTKSICNSLGESTCWCYNAAENYCDPFGDNIQNFKKKCEAWGDNWYWDEC
jgi:hypothetical protein